MINAALVLEGGSLRYVYIRSVRRFVEQGIEISHVNGVSAQVPCVG